MDGSVEPISGSCLPEPCYARAIMVEDRVVRFPGRFEAELAIAERAYDVIMERVARGRMPDDVLETG